MGKLRDEAEALGIEVDGRWSNGTLQRKIAERKFALAEETAMSTEPDNPVEVRLLKHFRPACWYEVVGYYDGNEDFHPGQMAPPPVPGASLPHKIWANTVIRLPAAEAQRLVENVATLVVTDRDPETKRAVGRRTLKMRKPLAEVRTDWNKLNGHEA